MLKGKRSSYCYPTNHTATTTSYSIRWIDSLLDTPIEDHRKYVMWRIVAPYLINIRKVSHDEALNVIRDWLNKCHQLKRLYFNVKQKIKYDLQSVGSYRPINFNNLKEENRELYDIVVSAAHYSSLHITYQSSNCSCLSMIRNSEADHMHKLQITFMCDCMEFQLKEISFS